MEEMRLVVRQAIKKIVAEELDGAVRSALQEMVGAPDPQEAPRRASRPRKSAPEAQERDSRPRLAKKHDVHVGQRWKARKYGRSKGRMIKIASLERGKVVPEVVHAAPGRTRSVAKRISYDSLLKLYEPA